MTHSVTSKVAKLGPRVRYCSRVALPGRKPQHVAIEIKLAAPEGMTLDGVRQFSEVPQSERGSSGCLHRAQNMREVASYGIRIWTFAS